MVETTSTSAGGGFGFGSSWNFLKSLPLLRMALAQRNWQSKWCPALGLRIVKKLKICNKNLAGKVCESILASLFHENSSRLESWLTWRWVRSSPARRWMAKENLSWSQSTTESCKAPKIQCSLFYLRFRSKSTQKAGLCWKRQKPFLVWGETKDSLLFHSGRFTFLRDRDIGLPAQDGRIYPAPLSQRYLLVFTIFVSFWHCNKNDITKLSHCSLIIFPEGSAWAMSADGGRVSSPPIPANIFAQPEGFRWQKNMAPFRQSHCVYIFFGIQLFCFLLTLRRPQLADILRPELPLSICFVWQQPSIVSLFLCNTRSAFLCLVVCIQLLKLKMIVQCLTSSPLVHWTMQIRLRFTKHLVQILHWKRQVLKRLRALRPSCAQRTQLRCQLPVLL